MYQTICFISILLLQVSANFQYPYPQYPYPQYPYPQYSLNAQYANSYPYQYPVLPSIPNYGQYQYPGANYQQQSPVFSLNQDPYQNFRPAPEVQLPIQYQYADPGFYQPQIENRAPFYAQPNNFEHSVPTPNGNIPIEIIDVSNIPPHLYPLLNPRKDEQINETIALSKPTIEVIKPVKSNTVIKGNTSQVKINRMIDNNGKPVVSVVTGKPDGEDFVTEKNSLIENNISKKKYSG